jgi:hypothetical protein
MFWTRQAEATDSRFLARKRAAVSPRQGSVEVGFGGCWSSASSGRERSAGGFQVLAAMLSSVLPHTKSNTRVWPQRPQRESGGWREDRGERHRRARCGQAEGNTRQGCVRRPRVRGQGLGDGRS